jgi:hypothetical protein
MGGMRLLAIDPGPEKSGYVVWESKVPIGLGRVLMCGHEDNSIVRGFINDQQWSSVAIEMIASYGMAVGAAVFNTCVEVGRFLERAKANKIDCRLVFRKDVKMFVCRSMKAKDGNIRQSLIDHIGPVGTKGNQGPLYGVKSHAWAALAIAVTAANDPRMPGYAGQTAPWEAGKGVTKRAGPSS